MDEARRVLKDTFGFDDFRLSQAKVVERLLVDNANCLVLYPTGGGKSLCYQIPGICLPGLTLVISPLIALMKDQVDTLRKKGVAAASLDSSLSLEETRAVKDSIRDGSLKILYVAPERLNNESFVEMLRSIEISLLAVDESHCISQWGASFRPEYLKIARFTEEFDIPRVLCLTATATRDIAADICTSFKIDPEAGVFRIPVYRSNLEFLVRTAPNLESKLAQLIPILQARTGPAIVYVTLQKQAEETALALRRAGISDAHIYHAGLPADERKRVQDVFMISERSVVVATIAFGMGIDKNNIRQVVHLYMPKTLENYSQEVGRAGRDGLPSTCIVFLSAPDVPILEGFCRGDTCSQTSVQLWLQEVMSKQPDPDGALSFNLYEQGRVYDIRANVLNLLYAQLELTHNLIRAVTPFYQVYDITPRSPRAAADMQAAGGDAVAVFKLLKPRRSGWNIDVVQAEDEDLPRARIASQVTAWEGAGLIDVKASQVRARFQVLNALPKTSAEQEAIANVMYEGMVSREEDALKRLHKVIEFATQDDCLSQSLAAYFGDEGAVPNLGMCGHCTYCHTLRGTPFELPNSTGSSPDPVRIDRILAACKDRDDPRLLARLAFGITSPRLTIAKLSTRKDIFGSMGDTNFTVLLEVFTKKCEEAGFQPAIPGDGDDDEGKAPRKRKAPVKNVIGDTGEGSRGRGGAAKRGRYAR